jgi:hypothetical protein
MKLRLHFAFPRYPRRTMHFLVSLPNNLRMYYSVLSYLCFYQRGSLSRCSPIDIPGLASRPTTRLQQVKVEFDQTEPFCLICIRTGVKSVIDGVTIDESLACNPDNPWAVAAFVKGRTMCRWRPYEIRVSALMRW